MSYISAYVISSNKSEEVFDLPKKGKIALFTSPSILTEVASKLRIKFDWQDNKITNVLKQITRIAKVLDPKEELSVLNDVQDNRVLECALAAEANLIVTGDKHLLKLKNYQGIGIARVADLLYTVKE